MIPLIEKITKALRGDHALTHVIVICTRKPFFIKELHEEPLEMKTKKPLWERVSKSAQ